MAFKNSGSIEAGSWRWAVYGCGMWTSSRPCCTHARV